MSSALAETPRSQLLAEPRYFVAPKAAVSLGEDAAAFAKRAGLVMDPWQADVLQAAMGLRAGGKWASRNVGLLVPRQNGKGSILEARELFALFGGDERLIIHSAHRYDTSELHFQRLLDLMEGNRDLARHIRSVSKVSGKESITVRRVDGSRCQLKFKARTVGGAARGFSCDLLILDEAFLLPEKVLAAVLPTLSARENPQVWYTSSAGYPDSDALWRVVQRGRAGELGTYVEYGCESGADPADRDNWLRANPGLGIRLSWDVLEDNYAVMTGQDFAREHLGIWDEAADASPIPTAMWDACRSDAPREGAAWFGIEVESQLRSAAIGVAGETADGHPRVAIVERAPGIEWVVPRCVELGIAHVAMDVDGASSALVRPLEDAGIWVVPMRTSDAIEACGQLQADVYAARLVHPGRAVLDQHVAAARRRDLGDAGAWVFGRKQSEQDINALQAVTWALWLLRNNEDPAIWRRR